MIIEDKPDRADVDWLDEQINAFNIQATGYDDGRELAIFERDITGTIVAGLYGTTWGGCANIDLLWIERSRRGRGLGRKLLRTAEAEALRRGCALVVVSSHEFQAPNFYRRAGYATASTIVDKPVGSSEVYLTKRLDP
jgi:GNAT superfamily N-acetyltransferase